MNNHTLNEIKLLLAAEERPVAFFATVDASGHPRVRPLNLMITPDGFYVATSRKSRKVGEMARQNVVELVTLFRTENGNGYLRISGPAQEVQGPEKRRTIEDTHYPVKAYWSGIDDPDFVVFRVEPQRVEFIRPGEDDPLDLTTTFAAAKKKRKS